MAKSSIKPTTTKDIRFSRINLMIMLAFYPVCFMILFSNYENLKRSTKA